jgi:hypothetical protein
MSEGSDRTSIRDGLALLPPPSRQVVAVMPNAITSIWLSAVKSLFWHLSTKAERWEVIPSEATR